MIAWLVVNTLSILIIAWLIPGFHIDNWKAALLAALVIGIINITVKPILKILAFPITIITLGIFSLILNTLMLLLAAYITPGFKIDGFMVAFIASLLYSIIAALLSMLVKSNKD